MKFNNLTLLILAILALAGCGTPSNFYMITPKAHLNEGEISKGKKVIGIATVHIPDYLDRKEIITKESSTKLFLHNNDLWASNLAENIQNVLKIDLSAKTNRYTFLSYPWEEPVDDIYRVYLSIDSLDMDNAGQVTISGKWSIVNMESRKILVSKEFKYTQIADNCDYASMAEVTSDFINRISNSIIKHIPKR